MSERARVLALSFAFPPMAVPRAIQVPRLLRLLRARVAVVCGGDAEFRTDATIDPDVDAAFERVVRLPLPPRSLPERAAGRLADALRLGWRQAPDRYRAWNAAAFRALRRGQLALPFEPELLVTFGQPMSDHLFGLAWKRRTGRPWIAHFSDPWTGNPFRRDNPLTAWRNRRLEGAVLGAADALVFTAPETLALALRGAAAAVRRKALFLPHLCAPGAPGAGPGAPGPGYVIRSIGTFYAPRTPAPLFAAVEALAREAPALLAGVSIELHGPLGGFTGAAWPAARRLIRCGGPVSYAEGLALARTAHCLLTVDAPGPASPFFPSKLADYLGAGRFLLALTPPGPTARLVRECGGLVADPADPAAAAAALREVLERRPAAASRLPARYEPAAVAGRVNRVVERLLAAGAPRP